MKILILGSMTFSPEMTKTGEELRQMGYEVTLPMFTEDYAGCDTREEMHRRAVENKLAHNLYATYHKLIEEHDAILVLNKEKKGIEGYVGANSLIEMGFARALSRPIFLMHEIPQMDYREEIEATRPTILNGDLSLIRC